MTATWREDVLRQVFVPIDVEAILKIPVCTRQVEDFWAWKPDERGSFSVRSSYHMNMHLKMTREDYIECQGIASGTSPECKGWDAIWQTKVPSKLHAFAWRLAHNSIPMGDILHHRNMATYDTCALFGSPDNWRHSLMECSMARSIWALSNESMVEHICCNQEPSAKKWLFTMHEDLPEEEMHLNHAIHLSLNPMCFMIVSIGACSMVSKALVKSSLRRMMGRFDALH